MGHFAAMFASGVLAAAIAIAAVITLTLAIHWLRARRGSTRARETLFVGRWGELGPELYLVGKGVRRLRRPPAWALAYAGLEPVPPEGFVLSKSDVEAWHDAG